MLPVLLPLAGFAQEEGPAGNNLTRIYNGQIGGSVLSYNDEEWQQREIQGRVTDGETGESLAGVSIYFKGLNTPIITTADGYYALPVPAWIKEVNFSFPGYETKVINTGEQTVINVIMTKEPAGSESLIATGYLTERRKDIIGSVAVVNTGDMLTTPSANAAVQLQGRVAGVNVSDVGAVNATPRVRIRGISTLRGADPLYVIDGIPAMVESLNPYDIASVQVLKDAAASLYGARGGNGVIIITTRQGEAGKPRLDLNYQYGISYVSEKDFPDLLNPEEMGDLYWLEMEGAGRHFGDVNWYHPQYGSGPEPVIPEYILVNVNGSRTGGASLEEMRVSDPALFALYTDPENYDFYTHQIVRSGNTNWFDEVYNPASMQHLQMNASGGRQHMNYYISTDYYDRNHVSDKYSFFRRYSLRANASYQGRRLRLGENLQLSYSEGRNAGNGNAWNMPSLCPVYDIAGNPASSAAPGIVSTGDGNPVTNAWRNRFDGLYAYGLLGNVYAEMSLLDRVAFRSSVGIETLKSTDKDYIIPTYEHAQNIPPPARLVKNSEDYTTWIFTNTLNYARIFGRHKVSLLVGTEAINSFADNYTSTRTAPEVDEDAGTFPFIPSYSGSMTNHTWFSILGKLDYAFGDKYLIGFSMRRDKTSEVDEGRKIGLYPSVALGWRLSGEEFLNDVPWLDELKLRLSFGTAGNVNTTLETIATANAGLDMGLFSIYHADLSLHVDYFIKRSKDLLVFEPDLLQPAIYTGEMENRGLELSVSKKGRIKGIIDYEVSCNFWSYRNKVLGLTDNYGTTLAGGGTRMGFVTLTKRGFPIGTFYGYRIEGFFNSQQEVDAYMSDYTNTWLPPAVGRWRIKDVDGNHVINDYDKTRIGDPHPDFQMGLNLRLAYRNFDFRCFLFWSQGGEVFNLIRYNVDFNTFQYNRSARMRYESWTPEHMNAKLPKADLNDTYSNRYATDYFVEDATYVRLKQIRLGYTFSPGWLNKIRISHLRIYIQGENLWTGLGDFTGLDPALGVPGNNDFSMGIYTGTTPAPKQVVFGLDMGL